MQQIAVFEAQKAAKEAVLEAATKTGTSGAALLTAAGGDDDAYDDDFTFGQVVGIVAGALAGVAMLFAFAQRKWIGNGCPADAAAGAETSAV